MKIITLNTWGGRQGAPLLEFIKDHQDVDVFCFQEVYKEAEGKKLYYDDLSPRRLDLFGDIAAILPGHRGFFRPQIGDHYGLAMFIRKSLRVRAEGDSFVVKDRNFLPEGKSEDHARNVQYAFLETVPRIAILNFHGLWSGEGKSDTKDRLAQSKKVAQIISKVRNYGAPILCGDFNLRPDTASLRIIEQENMKNLIIDFGVKSTRTPLYPKEDRFADYILMDEFMWIKEFKVLPDVVSDHAPLFVELDIVDLGV